MQRIFTLLFILISGCNTSSAQCTGGISTFPYNETFELTNGNWVAGGAASDWAWGTPAKTVINSAGQGLKCWITGGLTGSSYNNGESSFLKSPCFDFSSLTNPRISFRVFWETERTFDGADMQYSLDGGTNWLNLGNANSNNTCGNTNWYNSGSVRFISNKPGWAGNIQTSGCTPGGGSGGWLVASHDLTALAGQSNVIFRFEFGAGTTCNNYDGFAIDDIRIAEAVPNTADFTFSCGTDLNVSFIGTALCATSYAWTFGDIASPDNTSAALSPSHIFSAPGMYTVTFTATFAGGITSVKTKQVTVLGVTTNIDQSILCAGGNTGQITATPGGSLSPYLYVWNTNPLQSTPTISGLAAGSYTVTVTSGTACPATSTVNITEPAAINVSGTVTPAICLSANGSVTTNVTGGTSPYTYLWSNSSVSSSLTNLSAGLYHLDVKDDNGCTAAKDFTVNKVQKNLPVNLGADTYICPGQKLTLNAGNYLSYLWQDNSTNSTFDVTITGNYSVKVEDADGCTGTDAIKVVVDCSDIYFPNAFTPNGDGKNETFGPAGTNLAAVKDYSFQLYNRYGELIFQSTDPYIKWNGRYKGKMIGNQTFVWMTTYTLNGNIFSKKGTVMLLR